MKLTKEFKNSEMYPKLAHRAETFALMVAHVESAGKGLIVETGTARTKDNWNGDGQSTLIFDWLCDNLPVNAKSVDLDPVAVEIAKSQVKNVEVVCSDSVKFLSSLKDEELSELKLLYLDSFDYKEELALDCQFHHMAELSTIWAKIPSGCLIVVDDRVNHHVGKHFMVAYFMHKLNIEPYFVGYQIGWIKP
jgi:hypothetical protein